MSCAVCRLPFLPDRKLSSQPRPEHFAPPGVLTESQIVYFERGFAFSYNIMGYILDIRWNSSNMFAARKHLVMPMVATWETQTKGIPSTFAVMHTACSVLFRRVYGIEEDSLENFRMIASVNHALGYPQGRENAGWWRHVNYAGVGEKIDLRPLWVSQQEPGVNYFKWAHLQKAGYGWLVNRPDIFPRFFPEVAPERVETVAGSPAGRDIVTRQPLKVLTALAAAMDPATYVNFTSTCRFLRKLALTAWQPLARQFVFDLRWAMPTAVELEQTTADHDKLAREDASKSPPTGDWYLYLGHVHRTKGMRHRRWIWDTVCEIKRAADSRISAFRTLEKDSAGYQEIDVWIKARWEGYNIFQELYRIPLEKITDKVMALYLPRLMKTMQPGMKQE